MGKSAPAVRQLVVANADRGRAKTLKADKVRRRVAEPAAAAAVINIREKVAGEWLARRRREEQVARLQTLLIRVVAPINIPERIEAVKIRAAKPVADRCKEARASRPGAVVRPVAATPSRLPAAVAKDTRVKK